MRIAVIGARNGSKTFLACSIPDLQSDDIIGNGNGLHFEIDSYCGDVIVIEVVLHKSLH